MNQTCVGVVQANILRVSRLTGAAGYLDAGASNLYVTSSIVELGSTPVFDTDTDLTQPNGSGDTCVSYAKDGSYKRHDLTASLCELDAELLEMLTGATLVTSGGDTVGAKFGTEPNTGWVCVELFSTVVEDGSPTGEYVVWVYPKCQFRRGQTTRNNGILTVPLTGKAFVNRNIGLGPDGTWPAVMDEPDSFYITSTLPTAACGYGVLGVGS